MSKTEILAGIDATTDMINCIKNQEQIDEFDLCDPVNLVAQREELKGMLATAN